MDRWLNAEAPRRQKEKERLQAKVVQRYLADGSKVAFAGDGFPDAEAARLVVDDLRFARGDLANVLHDEGLPFHSFDVWSDIADALLQRKA